LISAYGSNFFKLFFKRISFSGYIFSNWELSVNDEEARMRREVVAACSKLLFQHFSGGVKENGRKYNPGPPEYEAVVLAARPEVRS
jgi:hypothetical protein